MSRINALFRALLGGMADDREAEFTRVSKENERLWQRIANGERRESALRAEVHALEDAAAVRDARLREMAAEMRGECAADLGSRVYISRYFDKYADILTPADDEETT
jgi:hypothetical protein